MNIKIHRAAEGGYWAEVIEMPGCVSQGETVEEVLANIAEAIAGYSHSAG
jgi:predicted RNase H-like HicB family nuclease